MAGKNEPEIDLAMEDLFELDCLIKATDIRFTARCEVGHRQIFAFAVGNNDLGLYYLEDENSSPVIKRVLWFKEHTRAIVAMSFDPTGTWLLVASFDGSLFIVPALAIVGKTNTTNQIWSTEDVTSFTNLNNANASYASPSALTWWQGVTVAMNIGVIGTETGEIVFINLESGRRMNSTHVTGQISNLQICHDNEMNTVVSLLITNESREQWQLVLEHSVNGYVYPLDNDNVFNQNSTYAQQSNDNNDDGIKNLPVARSRLQGLKQLSVEKLVNLKQKLAETRNRNLMSSFIRRDNGSNNASDEIATDDYGNSYDKKRSNDMLGNHAISPTPLRRDVFLMRWKVPQDGKLMYIRYISSTNHATVCIHESATSSSPLSIHKMPERCSDVLLTSQLFYISDIHKRSLCVISRALSEMNKNEKSEPESIICRIRFDKHEEFVNKMYIVTNWTKPTDKKNDDGDTKYQLPTKVDDINMEMPSVDSCMVVTNFGVYQISLKKNLLYLFMDLVLERQEMEKAGKLALIFGLNVQQLLELAGDVLLSNKQPAKAEVLYKISRCRPLKTMLKFAFAGYTSELLNCLKYWLSPPAVSEHSISMRANLSDLAVIAFTEYSLRVHLGFQRASVKQLDKDFVHFLSTNKFYDEYLAVGITGQSSLWNILYHLAVKRGLYAQVLEVLMKLKRKLLCIFNPDSVEVSPNNYGLYMCISEPNFIQEMLMNPSLAKEHMELVHNALSKIHIFVLQRLIKLYDPTNVALRPLLIRYKSRYRTTSRSSVSSQCDSLGSTDSGAESIVEEIIETFILVLLTLIHRKTPELNYESRLMLRTYSPSLDKQSILRNVDFKRRLLSTGWSHAAIVRNGNIYTWGCISDGCLGTGPPRHGRATRYCLPEPIVLFKKMEVEVFSVSCGRQHTLAVTNNGVYVWGGNDQGQLGLGNVWQCPTPELIPALAREVITDAVAGQYHSVALTMDGRVFTWGWGVHGQLGHGNTYSKNLPTLVTPLLGIVIRHINAGHAHTMTLSTEGYVYVFGCNVFGQLGTGNTNKSSVPIKVNLQERIVLIATRYFHNLAVSQTNKLYIWGVSPQVLRLQSQAYKKTKVAEYWAAVERKLLEEFVDVSRQNDKIDSKFEELPIQQPECSNKIPNGKATKLSSGSKSIKSSKGINIGTLKEIQVHLTPTLIDTNLVRGQIVQISTGCHHSALLTKDGTVYTWGRNLDGQLGIGSRCEVVIPTPLSYNPIQVQVPAKNRRRSNESMRDEHNDANNAEFGQNNYSQILKAVRVCCGSDYTAAIQPGGTVLAWGNNNRAQLGRVPANKPLSYDKKMFVLKSAKRIVTLPGTTHTIVENPSPIPTIPSPTISYQSYDVTPLANLLPPLSLIEKTPGVNTLHYALEYFTGIFDSDKIIQKSVLLKNFQAASKLALLDGNYPLALSYQLEAIKHQNLSSAQIQEKQHDLKENIKRFDEQIERNLIDTLEESVNKTKMKMPNSKSLDTFQLLGQDELYTFNCQGGSEELCEESKDDDQEEMSLELKGEVRCNGYEPPKENGVSERTLYIRSITPDGQSVSEDKNRNQTATSNDTLLKRATEAIEFYINDIDDESHEVMRDILQLALDFWVENELSIDRLEAVLLKHMQKLFYPLGMLLFCHKPVPENVTENDSEIKSLRTMNSLSTKFCLQVCTMLLQHVDQGKPTAEYIEILSLLMAKHYGPPLTGYPGSSENKTPQQMMEGVMSTISSSNCDPRQFIHIKDPEGVSRLLSVDEDTVVFTCGHHFPISVYQSEIVPGMEADLLVSRSLSLPCTARYLGDAFNAMNKPETLCPVCIPRALQKVVKNVSEKRTNN